MHECLYPINWLCSPQQHTLIKPPCMNLFHYWIFSAPDHPKCAWVPLQLSAACWACTGENNTMVILNKRQENWTWICCPLPLSTALLSAVADRRWIYLLSCLCIPMSETLGKSITPVEECEGHTNTQCSQVTNKADVSGKGQSILIFSALWIIRQLQRKLQR